MKLSDLLSYENAAALKDIARETHQENKLMIKLTVRNQNDKIGIQTIISLVYLPTTIVAVSVLPFPVRLRLRKVKNFFSTQFVHTSESGDMHVSAEAWLLAAIAVPLTIVTILAWWLWSYGQFSFPPRLAPQIGPPRFRHIVNPFLSNGGEKNLRDLEAGNTGERCGDSEANMSPRTLVGSRWPTWSTTFSSAKNQAT
jgi:hypothetical protein